MGFPCWGTDPRNLAPEPAPSINHLAKVSGNAMSESAKDLPYPEIDLAPVRRYMQGRADASSVRAVASDIGIGHTSLEKFLDGSAPYAKNRQLIVEWYLREHQQRPVRERMEVPSELLASDPQQPAAADPEGHLDALLSDLRGEPRSAARLLIKRHLAHGYRLMGKPAPAWLSG
jgi:hypothetical protein